MRPNLSKVVLIANVLLLAACTSAQFSGTTPSNATSSLASNGSGTGSGNGSGSGSSSAAAAAAAIAAAATPGASSPAAAAAAAAAASPSSSAPGSTSPAAPNHAGSSATQSAQSAPVSSPALKPATPSSPGAVPTCGNGTKLVGARIAFLVDNSGSNSNTDCPNPTADGTSNGTDKLYSCGSQTARETAILAAYDQLNSLANANSSSSLAASSIGISYFPTSGNEWTGYQVVTPSWLAIDNANRSTLASDILFARKPQGVTPFSSALTAAAQMFQNVPNDGRTNVAVILTDGEPTDANPAAVLAQAAALKQSGIEVIVMTYAGTLASRQADDESEMQGLDNAQESFNNTHWFTSNYASFAAYIDALLGVNGQNGLVQEVTTSGTIIEVQNSSALAAGIQSLVKTTQVVGCSG